MSNAKKAKGEDLDIETPFDEVAHLWKVNDDLADRLRERDKENMRLKNLLTKNGICFQEE